MTIVMYDLAGAGDRRFREITEICGGVSRTVPVLDDDGTVVSDSWDIAEYLEKTYPDRPSLFGGAAGHGLSRFVQNWVAAVVHMGLIGMVVQDIHDHVDEGDRAYFRSDRERRFGKTLEEMQAGREQRLEGFRRSLHPLRLTLKAQPFLGGEAPLYADYIAFGAFQWARTISDFRVVGEDDPVWHWLERCRDLHGGLARAALTHY
jgi:glutathione S-transferase